MTTFACKSRDEAGELVHSTVEARSPREAMAKLSAERLCPIQVTAAARDAATRIGARGARVSTGRTAQGRIKRRDVLRFTTQLAAALRAGVPILTSVRLQREQARNPALGEMLADIHDHVEGGQPLSSALARHPKHFPEAYVNSVAAGELSGALDELLENLAGFLEADMEIRSDVRSALTYPAILVGTLGLAVSVLMVFVVPRFTVLYSDSGGDLPLPTQLLVAASAAVTDYALVTVVALVGLAFAFARWVRTERGRLIFDGLVLRIPVIGGLIRTAVTLRSVQMLGLFCHVGLPVLEGLATIVRTTGNRVLRAELERASTAVACGETLSNGLESAGCFDPAVRQMIMAGESTGSLEDSCRTVGEQLKKDLAYITKNLATFIEPLMTLMLAGIVLFVALATFLPMWDMVKVVGGE